MGRHLTGKAALIQGGFQPAYQKVIFLSSRTNSTVLTCKCKGCQSALGQMTGFLCQRHYNLSSLWITFAILTVLISAINLVRVYLLRDSQLTKDCGLYECSSMKAPDDVRTGYNDQTAPHARRSRLRPDKLCYPTPSLYLTLCDD